MSQCPTCCALGPIVGCNLCPTGVHPYRAGVALGTLEANALIAQLQTENATLRAERDAKDQQVAAVYVDVDRLTNEKFALIAERDAAQQQIATLTQELSVSRANHIDANQRNMQSVRELEAAEARCATLTAALEPFAAAWPSMRDAGATTALLRDYEAAHRAISGVPTP